MKPNWWQYYARGAEKQYAYCKVDGCSKKITPINTGRTFSTNALKKHMEDDHPDLIKMSSKPAPPKPKPVANDIRKFAEPKEATNNNEVQVIQPAKRQRVEDSQELDVYEQISMFLCIFILFISVFSSISA